MWRRPWLGPTLMGASVVLAAATAATPTIAQSWARRLNFWKLQPAPFILGTRISVSISSAASDDVKKPS